MTRKQTSKDSVLDALELKLHGTGLLDSSVILEQIRTIVGDKDIELLLSLAVRAFVSGDDDRACQYVDKAAAVSPDDMQVKKVRLFLLVANNDPGAEDYCSQLLRDHPDDRWIRELRQKIGNQETLSLSLPAIDSRWERLISSG